MADPVLISCLKDQWTKIATNVTTGQVKKKSNQPNLYLETYRDTGGTAPTIIGEGSKMFNRGSVSDTISAVSGIDIYVWTTEEDGVVRVDI